MTHKFRKVIPKTPLYKKNTYVVPDAYSSVYEQKGVTNEDEQKALFYLTQFGGFRLKRIPSYLQNKEEFFSAWFKIKHERGFFNFKANPTFISQIGSIKPEPLLKTTFKTESYTDKFLKENGFSRAEAHEIEDLQTKLNEHYRSARLSIAVPESGITSEDMIDLSRFNAILHLQHRPRAGGRFFQVGPGSSYQRISSSLRHFLTINGEKVSEIDLSASVLLFTNVVSEKYFGHPSAVKKNLIPDPYQYFLGIINSDSFRDKYKPNHDISRDYLKELLYTLIFSPSNSQERSVNRKLRLVGQSYSHEDLRSEFEDFFGLISHIKTKPLIKEQILPPHIVIYQEESRFAREVLRRGCLEEGLLVLPIHDSFITTKGDFSKLESIVCDVAEDLYGYVLPYKKKI